MENGEFKGTVRTEIINLKADIRELNIKMDGLHTKFDILSLEINTIKTKAQIYGVIAGSIISIIIGLILKYVGG